MFESPAADRITGGVLLTLGISMLVGGFTMDRLEVRQIHPASIPGLVPMALGVAMIVCSLLLIFSARRNLENIKPQSEPGSLKNLLVTAGLSLGYAAGLVGQLPFFAATAIFIFLFSVYFMWPDETSATTSRLRISVLTAVYAVAFALGISVLFQYGFLVRLP